MGDLKGAGDVGESEYGEKADMRERSGDGSIGDFKAIMTLRLQQTMDTLTVCPQSIDESKN